MVHPQLQAATSALTPAQNKRKHRARLQGSAGDARRQRGEADNVRIFHGAAVAIGVLAPWRRVLFICGSLAFATFTIAACSHRRYNPFAASMSACPYLDCQASAGGMCVTLALSVCKMLARHVFVYMRSAQQACGQCVTIRDFALSQSL